MSNLQVQSAMSLLSDGLDEYISLKMKPLLNGLDWTHVLSELDRLRGKDGWIYSRKDVALQLRMLTERLGTLGYPFDNGDSNRTLSSYGSVLRIVRRRWAHNDEFELFDVLSAVDAVRTVLAHIGDSDRAQEAASLRTSLLSELVDIPKQSATPEATDVGTSAVSPKDPPASSGQGVVLSPSSGLKGEISWEPWLIAVVGEPADLDAMRTNRVKEMVRSLIEEVVESEGPIHKDRLAKLVGYGFGYSKVYAARTKRILNQLQHTEVEVDSYGFVWPAGIDQKKWLIHRTNEINARVFEEVAPIEIANAAVAVLAQHGELSMAELRQKVLLQFGRKKNTKASSAHLERSLSHAMTHGMIPEMN